MLPGGDPMTLRLIALNGLRLSVAGALLCLSPAFAQTSPSQTQAAKTRVSPVTHSPATQTPAVNAAADQPKSRIDPCSAAWIQAAARAQVAPNLIGCTIQDVAVPLARVGILPSPSEHDGPEPAGTIIAQKPVAGEPLKRGGTLSLQFSTGKVPQPAQETPAPATSAEPETSPASAAPVEPEPVPESAAAPSSETAQSATAESVQSDVETAWPTEPPPKQPSVWEAILSFLTTYPLAILIGLGVAITAIVLSLSGGKGGRKTSRKSSRGLPQVTCEAEFGPGRLVVRGPLVLGEKGGG